MRRFFSRRRSSRAATSALVLAINRILDAAKHRVAAALSRWEKRMTRRQKKWALMLFCLLGASVFSFEAYKGLFQPPNHPDHFQHLRMPVGLPPPAAPPGRHDSAFHHHVIDSTH